jgi:hypothetical protein
VNLKDHPIMQELERIRIYIRKMNSADQVPTERTSLGRCLLITGTLVVDREAAQRIISHGIPKSQIIPDPNTTVSAGQKRASPVSERVDGPVSKKKKTMQSEAAPVTGSTKSTDTGKGEKKKKKKRKADQTEGGNSAKVRKGNDAPLAETEKGDPELDNEDTPIKVSMGQTGETKKAKLSSNGKTKRARRRRLLMKSLD